MAKQILILRTSSSGYSVWRDDDMSVHARFSTIRRARSYLRKVADQQDGEFKDDQLHLEDDLFQIVEVDLEEVPLDPRESLLEGYEDEDLEEDEDELEEEEA